MPRKPKKGIFKFSELSEEAQERAINDFRNKYPERLFDHIDADDLHNQFVRDLQDHYGLGEMGVGFSLVCCQGDGVCFWGNVDVEKFIDKEGKKERFGLLNNGVLSVKIIHFGHYCHAGSMRIESDFEIKDYTGLLPGDIYERYEDYQDERSRILDAYQNEVAWIKERNRNPVMRWEYDVRAWETRRGKGVKAWIPEPRPSMPSSAQPPIPLPPEPELPEMPYDIKDALAKAQEDIKRLDSQERDFIQYLESRIVEISMELEKAGYSEIEYKSSDAYLKEELLESPSYEDREYAEDGSLVEDRDA